jgi:hypothetical protein
LGSPSRLRLLLDHFSLIKDAREPHRVAFPMAELLLVAVCGMIADCDYDAIALWGDTHLDFLRRFLPYHHGVPSGHWLTIMMNRINPALLERLAADGGLKGAIVTIDAIACNGAVARAVREAGATIFLWPSWPTSRPCATRSTSSSRTPSLPSFPVSSTSTGSTASGVSMAPRLSSEVAPQYSPVWRVGDQPCA